MDNQILAILTKYYSTLATTGYVKYSVVYEMLFFISIIFIFKKYGDMLTMEEAKHLLDKLQNCSIVLCNCPDMSLDSLLEYLDNKGFDYKLSFNLD